MNGTTGWRETVVRSWTELLDALHDSSMIPLQPGEGSHFRSPYVFRGMSDESWALQTSLERLGSPPSRVESALIRSFRKYAPRGSFVLDSDWEALAVAQHNGLPTRVLDWSVSPLIAAHFATCERKYFDTDGVVWCVNVLQLREEVLPAAVADPLRAAHAAVYDVRLLTSVFPTLDALDALTAEVCAFLEPPSIDARIANQFGVLSVMNGPAVSHFRYFQAQSLAVPGLVHKIVISKQAKGEIRDMLDQNNVNERMLFPGLPGLCDWLRRYYGPA